MTLPPIEAMKELLRLSDLLDAALVEHEKAVEWAATTERDYRKEKAEAWVNHTEGTAAEREALVDAATADQRGVRDIAAGARQGALESIRSRRTQISALQSLLGAHKAEAEFSRTGSVADR